MSSTSTSLFEASQSQALDRKTAAALLYLALPVALFFAGWLQPWFAATLLAALALGLSHALRPVFSAATRDPSRSRNWLWGLTAVALVWTSLGGLDTCFTPTPTGAFAMPCCAT